MAQIIWHGQSCFQISATRPKSEQVSIVIDPFSEEIGLKPPSLTADILLITHDHPDHNNKKAVLGSPRSAGGAGTPFLITGPGEYETKEVFIQGIPAYHDNKAGAEKGQNTIYTIEVEELRICHLGDLGQTELTAEQLEAMGDIDILMIPVGGVYTIAGKEAPKIISQIEPRIVIPMHYFVPKLKIKLEGVEPFLKAMGAKSVEPQPKLSIKKKDLTAEEMAVVLLRP